ncbi:MAG: dockerin type I domain-containing protein [Planctomycetota bacterium]
MHKERIRTGVGLLAGTPLAFASTAHAQVAYTELGPVSGDFSAQSVDGFTSLAVPLDFDGDGVEDLQIRTRKFDNLLKVIVDGDESNSQANNDEDEIIAFTGGLDPIALSAGDLIEQSPAQGEYVFASNDDGLLGDSNIWTAFTDPPATSSDGDFPADGQERFVAVRTQIDGNTHFGWIGIVIDSETFSPVIGVSGYVTGIAYNTVPNTPIEAGDRGSVDPCPADVNGDGALSDSDFFAWVTAFIADPRTPEQEAACDVNRDGSCSDSDFFAWVTIFIGDGCP